MLARYTRWLYPVLSIVRIITRRPLHYHSPSSADYGASLDSETTVGTALGLASCSGAQKRKQPHQPTASAATLSVAVAQKSAPMLA